MLGMVSSMVLGRMRADKQDLMEAGRGHRGAERLGRASQHV